ncbi:MAG: hypothetical protein LLG37_10635 [Spirochaetia bacterium]|nr:hypothetical protein [Spirochaetia bacterium]
MKKIICLLTVIAAMAAVSCTPLDRTNPTDPAADNYAGMHYMGTIGDFTQLNDFGFENGTMWAVGIINTPSGTSDAIATYFSDGSLNYFFTSTAISAPTGIASDGTYLYVLCTDPYTSAYNPTDIKKFSPSYVSDTAMTQPPNYAGEYRYKCAVNAANNYLYLSGADTVMIFDTAANSTVAVFGSGGTADGQFSAISDIEVCPDGNVLVADPGLNRISIFSPTGTYMSKIDIPFTFSGVGIEDNSIYIPSSDGIHKIRYDTGESLLFADYGDGNGKVMQAGPCEAHGGRVYAGTASAIKVFGP